MSHQLSVKLISIIITRIFRFWNEISENEFRKLANRLKYKKESGNHPQITTVLFSAFTIVFFIEFDTFKIWIYS